jgi:hypothetical protein
MSKITITVGGPVGVGKSAVCAKLETLLKHAGYDVEWVGGQEERNLGIEEWSDAKDFLPEVEILERVEKSEESNVLVSDIDPIGFMMKHQTGDDLGFSWNRNDSQFPKEWKRIGLYTEDQVIEMLRENGTHYDDRARKWRTSFDSMHQRAMRAEDKITRLTHERAVFRSVLEGQEFNHLDELPNLENAVERAHALGARAAQISKDVRKTLELVQQHFAPGN